MLLIVIIFLISSLFFWHKFSALTIEIEIKRGNLEEDYKAGKYDFSGFPVPYFSEPNDSEEVTKMIKRRGLFIRLFWICFILFLVIGFIVSPPSNLKN